MIKKTKKISKLKQLLESKVVEIVDSKKCDTCGGQCCEQLYLEIPYVNEDEKRWINLHKKIQVVNRNGSTFVKIDLPCSALQYGKCSIYEDRPDVCKQYDPSQCDNINSIEKIKEDLGL